MTKTEFHGLALTLLLAIFGSGSVTANASLPRVPDLDLVKLIVPADPDRVRRNYRNLSQHLQSAYGIFIEGSPQQIRRVTRWLDQIYKVPIGRDTIQQIMDSGNKLIIRHSEWALDASGRTSAPVSSHLVDGVGENVVILFDSRIPDGGSHKVFNTWRQPIEFSATQNLFHELSHAKHLANGSWRYFDSEGQAIEEENEFRVQSGELSGSSGDALRAVQRAGKKGRQFWWPTSLLADENQ